jgi:Mg2+-importing ATPase
MGDGINDAPALKAADIGISVDTATDIAKESADLILLEKDLMVLEGGVIEGRKVFANILKYIRMGASSNFGNMFSVLGASAFLPFLPMAPDPGVDQQPAVRLLASTDPDDAVDEEQVAGRGPGTSARSSASFFSSAPSARSSTIRPSSSCSGFSTVGTHPAHRCFRRAGSSSR